VSAQKTEAAARAVDRELGAGAWSYFGDPRAISHDGHTFTGWISTAGNVWVARYTRGGKLSKRVIYEGLGRDDHNNPSLIFRPDGHLIVFFAPHSGHHLPPPGIRPSRMRYRVSLHRYSIEKWGRVRTVPTNVPGGLGYTYPNPIQLKDKLWLFWRGGGWNPTFSYTEDGHEWVRARELVYSGGDARPYAKYVGDGNQRIHAIFSDGNATSTPSGLHYLRYEARGLFGMGRKLGTLRDVPLPMSKLDHIYRYSSQGGSAWPHDIALTSQGRPRIVYTRLRAGQDTFYYAYHNGTEWISRRMIEAGRGREHFGSGGASLDHEDPRFVYLSRTIGTWSQVEQWFTPDEGRTWSARQLTSNPSGFSARPVTPRGLRDANRVLFFTGDERTTGWRKYVTRVHALDF
jgi:hypothetical protein